MAGGRARLGGANNDCRRDILERLRADGPLPTSELPDTCVVPWASSGWNNNRNVRMMLDKLVQRGEVAAAGGTGRDRLWDLASRIYPDDPVPPSEEARRLLDERRLSALGIARARAPSFPSSRSTSARPASPPWSRGSRPVAGRPGPARPALRRPGGAAVAVRPAPRRPQADERDLRVRLHPRDVQARRRPVWGYYALPILYGDRLVGKLDARADHKAVSSGSGGPPGRAVQQGDDGRGRPRDQRPGPLARPGHHPATPRPVGATFQNDSTRRLQPDTMSGVNPETVKAMLVRHWEYAASDQDIAHEIYHDDAVLEFPQSGERFVGVENFREWRRKYPASLAFEIREIRGRDDFWVAENLISYDQGPWNFTVNILEFRGNKVARESIYISEGWEAPEWRAQWRAAP